MKLRGLIPNSYIHVSVSDVYIPTIGLPIMLQENTVGGPIVRINRITDTRMWTLGLRPRSFFSGSTHINRIYFAMCT
jgi:hypothetical protein